MSGRAHDGATRPAWVRVAAVVGALCCIAVFLALGTWQVQRLQWKRALIARVEQRVHLAPVPAPTEPVTREGHEYLHVVVDGVYLPNRDTLVQAVTDLGPGYWVLTPLCRPDGTIVLINRGFTQRTIDSRLRGNDSQPVIPAQAGIDDPQCPAGLSVRVTGLLRLPEPTGAFLRHNDPAANRWYSRDVEAIATARGLQYVAPYFIDADAAPQQVAGEPIGGLTVIRFSNNHLQYALTWYAMALMAAGALAWILRASRQRKPTP